eukprot:SAG31_NODE_2760_length_5133_cov_12.708582_5_plen_90_part_00
MATIYITFAKWGYIGDRKAADGVMRIIFNVAHRPAASNQKPNPVNITAWKQRKVYSTGVHSHLPVDSVLIFDRFSDRHHFARVHVKVKT